MKIKHHSTFRFNRVKFHKLSPESIKPASPQISGLFYLIHGHYYLSNLTTLFVVSASRENYDYRSYEDEN